MHLRLLGALAFLTTSACGAIPAQAPPDSAVSIIFSNVGQGDAAFVVTPERKTILIDAGPSTGTAERMFFETTFDTLDLVVASHNHADHIGGLPWVFDRFVVRAFMSNEVPHTSGVYGLVLHAAQREPGLLYLEPTERSITVGSVTLRVLPPPRRDESQNNNSVGILLEYGNFRALFTGDSELEELEHWLRTYDIQRVHVLKGAHHGSSNGVTQRWIDRTRPASVVISASATNQYGHPSPFVIRAWEQAGARVYVTSRDGSIHIVGFKGGRHTVYTDRNVLSAPIRK